MEDGQPHQIDQLPNHHNAMEEEDDNTKHNEEVVPGGTSEGAVVEVKRNRGATADIPTTTSSSLDSASTVPTCSPPSTPPRKIDPSAAAATTTTSSTIVGVSPKTQVVHHLHPSNLKTPQMMVLGKDGSDYRDLMTSRSSLERQQALLEGEEKTEEHFNGNGGQTTAAAAAAAASSQSSSWWNRLLHIGKPANGHYHSPHNSSSSSPHTGQYTSMDDGGDGGGGDEDEEDKRSPGRSRTPIRAAAARIRRPKPQQQASDVEAPVYYQGLDEDPLQSPPPTALHLAGEGGNIEITQQQRQMPGSSILRNLPQRLNTATNATTTKTTREEQVQQDCSFLYRPVEESPGRSSNGISNNNNNKRRTTLRAILDPPPAGVSTLYRDAQEILSPPVMARFKAQYQQLNQEYAIKDDYDRFADYNEENFSVAPSSVVVHHHHDLTLEEQQQAPPSGLENQQNHQALVAQTVAQSSLFYQHEANGRVLLRLPRDHVRLLMASDLEPGILSVIQYRRPPSTTTTAEEEDPCGSGGVPACSSSSSRQPLEYCLTVPSNLYQRVVSEINHAAVSAHHGSDGSFYASEHADIRWAIGIMVIIMTILGINTLVFGLD